MSGVLGLAVTEAGPRPWAASRSTDRVVVIVSSAGGTDAMMALLGDLAADFPVPIVIVQHRGERRPELLVRLLASATRLHVRELCDGDILEGGVVYVCPPDAHAFAERSFRVVSGPRLDHVRPSADVALRSIAEVYGSGAIGIVLSGHGSDGAIGAFVVGEAGGTVLAQEPTHAKFSGMPLAAVERGNATSLPLASIAQALREIAGSLGPETVAIDPPRGRTRVLLVDDHRLMLEGLRTLLLSDTGIEIVGEAENGAAAVLLAAETDPDVIVMDVSMPGMDGLVATRRLVANNPRVRVVILSARVDSVTARHALDAGATGFVSKEAAFSEVVLAIRAAATDTCYLSPRIAAALRSRR